MAIRAKRDHTLSESDELFWISIKQEAGLCFFTFDNSKLMEKKDDGSWDVDLENGLRVRLHTSGGGEIGLTYTEIQGALEPYYEKHVDELLRYVLTKEEGGIIHIDTLLLSGRAAQLPGLRLRILDTLQALYRGQKMPACPEIPAHRLKEAVCMGALEWAMKQRTQLLFEKYPVYGSFGLALMRFDRTWEWIPLFRHDQPKGKTKLAGLELPTYNAECSINPSLYSRVLFLQSHLSVPGTFIQGKSTALDGKPLRDLLEESPYFNVLYAMEADELMEKQRSFGRLRLGMRSGYAEHETRGAGFRTAIYAYAGVKSFSEEPPDSEPGTYAGDEWWPFSMMEWLGR